MTTNSEREALSALTSALAAIVTMTTKDEHFNANVLPRDLVMEWVAKAAEAMDVWHKSLHSRAHTTEVEEAVMPDWADEYDRGRFTDAVKFLAGFGFLVTANTTPEAVDSEAVKAWQAMTNEARRMQARHLDCHEGDVYHAMQSLCAKFGSRNNSPMLEDIATANSAEGKVVPEAVIIDAMEHLPNNRAATRHEMIRAFALALSATAREKMVVDEELTKDAARWRYLVAENNKGGLHGKYLICWYDPKGDGYCSTNGVSMNGKDDQAIVRIIDAAMLNATASTPTPIDSPKRSTRDTRGLHL